MNPDTDRVSDVQLAAFLGVEPRTIRNQVRAGVLQQLPGSPVRYELRASVQRYCRFLSDRAASRGSLGYDGENLTAQRTRGAKATADKLEMEVAQRRGELVPLAKAESQWTALMVDLRQALLAIPSRIAQRLPHLTPADVRALDAELRAAMTEAAHDGFV